MRRAALPLALLLAATPAAAQEGREHLFVSPMGEPFRGDAGGAPQERWFAGADADHDGAISRAEFARDAARFFRVVDQRGDGEIDPDDLQHYEGVLLPEVTLAATAVTRDDPTDPTYNKYRGEDQPDPGRGGAARYNYLPLPEPITPADTNFNRGVDEREWRIAADQRFAALDSNGDGRITRAELPRFTPRWGIGAGEPDPAK